MPPTLPRATTLATTASLPRTAREIRLAEVPSGGLPGPEHLTIAEVPLPVPGHGEVLVRNRWFQVFPSLRTLIAGGVPGTPFPALHPGDTLFGPAVGEVVAAPADGDLRPGDLIAHFQGWREFAAVPATAPLGDSCPTPPRISRPAARPRTRPWPGSPGCARARRCSSPGAPEASGRSPGRSPGNWAQGT